MGLRGPKPKTPTNQAIRARLQALGPSAVELINSYHHGQVAYGSGPDDKPALITQARLDNAWRIIEQCIGKAPQSVDLNLDASDMWIKLLQELRGIVVIDESLTVESLPTPNEPLQLQSGQ